MTEPDGRGFLRTGVDGLDTSGIIVGVPIALAQGPDARGER